MFSTAPTRSSGNSDSKGANSAGHLDMAQIYQENEARRGPLVSSTLVLELLAARAVVGGQLAMAAQQPPVGQQADDADGTARVQLVGADADLRALAVAVTVGEPRAGVVILAGGIDRGEETRRRRRVVGDDRTSRLA